MFQGSNEINEIPFKFPFFYPFPVTSHQFVTHIHTHTQTL